MRRTRAAIVTLAVAFAIALAVTVAPAPRAAAQDEEPTVESPVEVREADSSIPSIIPRPDEGRGPEGPGDPGGAYQYLVLALIVAGVAFIGWRVIATSKKALAAADAARAPARPRAEGRLSSRSSAPDQHPGG